MLVMPMSNPICWVGGGRGGGGAACEQLTVLLDFKSDFPQYIEPDPAQFAAGLLLCSPRGGQDTILQPTVLRIVAIQTMELFLQLTELILEV